MSNTPHPGQPPESTGKDLPVGREGLSRPAVPAAAARIAHAQVPAGAALPFAVLHHTGHGPAHWDFLLQIPGREKLLTWRLAVPPEEWHKAPSSPQPAARIDDHRPAYLTHEGPISGNRGQVKRVASGTATLLEQSTATLRLRLSAPLSCDLELPL